MRPPNPRHDEPTDVARTLARYTPDSRRWRRTVAVLSAVGAPLTAYAALAIITGVKTGIVYNLLILVSGLLALTLPAVAAASLLAPNSEGGRSRRQSAVGRRDVESRGVAPPHRGEPKTHRGTDPAGPDSETVLKRRFAAGEIDYAEFERRLDAVVDPPVGDGNSTREDSGRDEPTHEPAESNSKSVDPSQEVE